MKAELLNLYREYKLLGSISSSELRLPPQDAIEFASRLADLGIMILIADGWYYADDKMPERGLIQDIGTFFSMEDSKTITAQDTAKQVKEFILALPAKIVFVSFTLDVANEWLYDLRTV